MHLTPIPSPIAPEPLARQPEPRHEGAGELAFASHGPRLS